MHVPGWIPNIVHRLSTMLFAALEIIGLPRVPEKRPKKREK